MQLAVDTVTVTPQIKYQSFRFSLILGDMSIRNREELRI